MKLLVQVYSSSECARIETLLNERGIATYARSIGGSRTGTALGADIFVCIDAQLNDAMALLSDPEHEVAQPIDVAEFNQAVATADVTPIAKWLVFPVTLIVLLFAGMVYLLYSRIA
jgi:hypothetical protein